MQQAYQTFKARWKGYKGYDVWMSQGLNNAKLSTISSYNQWLPAFQQLLQREQGDLARFYQACNALAKLSPAQRDAQLQVLANQSLH